MWNLPKRLASFTFTKDPDQLLCAFDDELAFWNLSTGQGNTIHRLNEPDLRFNDGRADSQGRFWVGTMVTSDNTSAFGALFRLDQSLELQEMYSPISISNSICWSANDGSMYFSDSKQRLIWRSDLDDLPPLEVEVHIKLEAGEPDGATTDRDGNLWVACWGIGEVRCYAPDGNLIEQIAVPARQPSCIAFGGPNLDHLLITSARIGLNAPGSADGNLFLVRTNYKGAVQNECFISAS